MEPLGKPSQFVSQMLRIGEPRSEIVGMLVERFGEQSPDVGVQQGCRA